MSDGALRMRPDLRLWPLAPDNFEGESFSLSFTFRDEACIAHIEGSMMDQENGSFVRQRSGGRT